MKKEITICFRTSEELRHALEGVAREDRRSLSSAIVLFLTDYLKKNKEFPQQHERRRYARKQVAIPAFIKGPEGNAIPQHGDAQHRTVALVLLEWQLAVFRIGQYVMDVANLAFESGTSRDCAAGTRGYAYHSPSASRCASSKS